MKRPRTDYIILHTAAWPGNPSIMDIRQVHVRERGWSDVGYHFVIRKDGTVEEGRPVTEVGAHCRADGMNFKSIGICISGHGDEETLVGRQRSAMYSLVFRLMRTYDIHPVNVLGHREVGAVNKTCPGKLIDMNKIREGLQRLHDEVYKINVEGDLLYDTNEEIAAPLAQPLPAKLDIPEPQKISWIRSFLAGENKAGKIGSKIKNLIKHFVPFGHQADQLTDLIGNKLKTPATMSEKIKKNESTAQKVVRFLKQKSTQQGITGVLALVGIAVEPELYASILTIAGGVISVIQIVTDEEK